MKRTLSHWSTRLYLCAVCTLLAGLGSALFVYLTASVPPDDPLAEYENSKLYRRGLELYGGQFNVLADEARRWFFGLWQGRTLASTVAVITVVVSFILWYVARDLERE